MTVHPDTRAVLAPQGPALGYHEGQMLLTSARQLAEAGLARLYIDLGGVRWVNGPGFSAMLQIQNCWDRPGQCMQFLKLPDQIERFYQNSISSTAGTQNK